jgi:hypothetical protein
MQRLIKRRVPNWLILGFGMGAIAIALFVSAANKPLPEYLVASSNLRPGQLLVKEDFESVALDLGPLADKYLTADAFAPNYGISVVARSGELIALDSLTSQLNPELTSIRFTPGLQPSSSVKVGGWVSIWQVVEVDEVFEAQRLISRAEVSNLIVGEGLFATDSPEIEISLRLEDSVLVLAALSAGLDVYVLPVL